MEDFIKLGEYVEQAIDWLSVNAAGFFKGITNGVNAIVDSLEYILMLPHPFLMMGIIAVIAYMIMSKGKGYFTKAGVKAGWGMAVFVVIGLFVLFGMGFWEETMQTFALVIASALLAIFIGIPLGIYASRSDSLDAVVRPVLDFMQTMPPFVYLIPAILFFSVGNVPGVVATVIFSLPPAVRLTNLGIRGVQQDVVEASRSFGCTDRQLLYKVQIPLAMPTILAGVNQVIMLALSMVVIASMVGAGGLGQSVYRGILKADMALGFEAGLGIVVVAIILDRLSQAAGTSKK